MSGCTIAFRSPATLHDNPPCDQQDKPDEAAVLAQSMAVVVAVRWQWWMRRRFCNDHCTCSTWHAARARNGDGMAI
eukprot:7136250-Alexandrium_andersonii.AAC.1